MGLYVWKGRKDIVEVWKKIKIHKTVYGIWSIFLVLLLISLHSSITNAFSNDNGYIRLVEICIFLGIFLEYQFWGRVSNKWSENGKRAFLFVMAFFLRLLSLLFSEYTPTNDFANYFHGACYFAENGFSGGFYESLENYGIAEFAGQEIINGFLLKLLSPTLLGMQILNSVYLSGICVLIYEIGTKITTKTAAMAAIFYTFYPCSIISGHVTTNTHGAAFFMMVSILFFDRAQNEENKKKKIYNIVVCASSLVISNFYHPSAAIVVCAYAVYTLGCGISDVIRTGRAYRTKKMSSNEQLKGKLILTAAILGLYFILSAGTLELLRASGFIRNEETHTILLKAVFGFNEETIGGYSQEDADFIFSYPQEEQNEACIRLIQERLQDPLRTVALMVEKTKRTWFEGDNYFYFYADGVNVKYSAQIGQMQDEWLRSEKKAEQIKVQTALSELSTVNDVFVYIMWGFALLGIATALWKHEERHMIYLILYIPLGWMLFIMISEMQSRYRYQGFIMIVLLAAYGLTEAIEFLHVKKEKSFP